MGEKSERSNVVFVPRRPGRLISPPSPVQRVGEIDGVLDDLFGEEDQEGPSATDALLVAFGAGAVGIGQLAGLPSAVTVVGIGLIGLGAILPVRSAIRHASDRRQRSRAVATIGDGIPLRQDDQVLSQLADLHDQIYERSERLVPNVRSQVLAVAHALVEEVATLLSGGLPAGAAEVEYVTARAEALVELAASVTDPRIGDGDTVRRKAIAEARIEIEQVSGKSALTDSADLLNELRPDADA